MPEAHEIKDRTTTIAYTCVNDINILHMHSPDFGVSACCFNNQ